MTMCKGKTMTEKHATYMRDWSLDNARAIIDSTSQWIAETERNRDEQINYCLNQAAKYEREASNARILRVCLTGKP